MLKELEQKIEASLELLHHYEIRKNQAELRNVQYNKMYRESYYINLNQSF